MGAAGRDFHNFNTFYRDNDQYDVAAFTATQIPDIEGRVYPAELAGDLYPNGIPIHDESELLNLISKHKKINFKLNHTKNYGVVVPPKIWIKLHFLQKDSIVLVICDKKYEYKDYIGTYKKYLNFIKKK